MRGVSALPPETLDLGKAQGALAPPHPGVKGVSVFVVEKENDIVRRGIDYIIELEDNKLIAKKAIYPHKDPEGRLYGNKYEYEYIINLYSPAWARLEVYQLNKGWSPGTGGMWDSILLFRKTVRKSEVKELVDKIKTKLDTLKDGDLEIKSLVAEVEEFFNRVAGEAIGEA